LREGYSVTLEGNEQRLLAPVRGGNAQMMLLDALARVDLARESVVEPIMRLVSNPSRDTHIVLITPRLDAESAARLNFLVERVASAKAVREGAPPHRRSRKAPSSVRCWSPRCPRPPPPS